MKVKKLKKHCTGVNLVFRFDDKKTAKKLHKMLTKALNESILRAKTENDTDYRRVLSGTEVYLCSNGKDVMIITRDKAAKAAVLSILGDFDEDTIF